MKKLISLLLVFILCMGLCACSGEDPSENTESLESEFADHPLLAKLFGTWTLIHPENKENALVPIPFDVLTINKDKTCVIDGVEATWNFSKMYSTATALEISIYINGERVCGAIVQEF